MSKQPEFIVLFTLLFIFFCNAQEDNYRFSVGYGLANGYFPTLNDIDEIDYNTPSLGRAFEFSFDFLLADGKSIGIGYAMQSMTRTIDDRQVIFRNTGLQFDNYRLEYETQFYDIHFRKQFKNRIGLTIGVFYYLSFQGHLRIESDGLENGVRFYSFSDYMAKNDNFGLSPALDYQFVIKKGLSIGLQARVFYTLAGIEAFSVTPIISFEF